MREILQRKIIPGTLRYLVKGRDIDTGSWVIGFPYILYKEKEEGIYTLKVILELSEESPDHSLDSHYAIGIPNKEFHIVQELYKFVYIDENNIAHFEDEIPRTVGS